MPSCSAWPGLRGGLAALCLLSQLSDSVTVWSRRALLRRLGPRRCECELDSIPSRVFHLNSYVNCLSARGIEERIVSQSSTWLLVGKAGWLASGTRGRLICHLRQFGPPLCGPAYRRPPAESSHGSYERSSGFLQKLGRQYLFLLLWPLFDIFKKYIYRIRVFIFPCNSLHT